MSAALSLVITDAGRDALVAAAGTSAVVIAEAGFTGANFIVAPTLTALPGEFKRVDSIAGEAVDSATVHLVIRDSSDDAYTVKGIGLYLDDGTLFAVYGQAGAILGKASVSTFHLAVDVKFLPGEAELVELGNTSFLNPPATEETKGVLYLATLIEALAGLVDDKAITPASMASVLANYVLAEQLGIPDGVATLGPDGKLLLSQRPPIDLIDVWPCANEAEMLDLEENPGISVGDFAVRADNGLIYVLQALPADVLGNWLEISTPAPVSSVNGKVGTVVLVPADIGAVPTGRTVTGAGLLAGQGGPLNVNQVITLTIASAAEAAAGLNNTKALTPASLATILTTLAAKAAADATVTGGGLVTGGGPISASPVLTVPIASPADVAAGTDNTKALTSASLAGLPASHYSYGYQTLPGGLILQWIKYRAFLGAEMTISLSWPTAFTQGVFVMALTGHTAVPSSHRNMWPQIVGEPGQFGATIQTQSEEADDLRLDGIDIIVIGK